MSDRKRPLCTAPFIGYHWRGNQSEDKSFEGILRPCCEARPLRDQHDQIIIDRGIKIVDVTEENLLEHKFLQDIRKPLMEGEFHDVCHDCEYREKKGLVSSRDNYLQHALKVEEFYPDMEYDVEKGNNLGKLFYLDYRPSNLCNLKCRMCGPVNSSLFAEEILPIKQMGEYDQYVKDTRNKLLPEHIYDKKANEKLHNLLDLSDMTYIKFLGGEPLFMKEPLEMIERMGKNAHVTFTTNATKITDHFVDTMKNADVRRIQIGVSLDGIGDVYEYIRFPGKWDRTEKNLERLFELKDNTKAQFDVTMTFVCQLWNAYQLPDIIRWSLKFFRKFYPDDDRRGPFLSMVTQRYLRLQHLDDDDKNWLTEELYGIVSEYDMTDNEIRKYIQPLIIQMEDEPIEEDIKQFAMMTRSFDNIRNQDVLELDERFKKYV